MRTGTGPSFRELRPFQTIDGRDPVQPGVFPVYDDLVGHLRKPESDPTSGEPDEVVAHVLSVLSTYAYSDLDTLLEMATRLGLERCEGLAVELRNDPLFVVSTAYLVTSSDGSVGILVYRGTMPVDLINWLTDVDATQEQVRLGGPDTEPLLVHAGFYRNVRATRFRVAEALAEGLNRLQSLYITGHSLGGAMAALMGILVRQDADYRERLEPVLQGVYTYGQPMVGSPELARHCGADPLLGSRMHRFIYEGDPVPRLPSRDTGHWAHFGRERRYTTGLVRTGWNVSGRPVGQLRFIGDLALAFGSLPLSQLVFLNDMPAPYRIDDHRPHHYIAHLTPPGRVSEFGDRPYESTLPFPIRLRRQLEGTLRTLSEAPATVLSALSE